jgi:hypothetical protein
MIGRVFRPGGSFGRTCEYVAEDLDRAHVLYQDGVRGHDYRLAARDFEMIAALHPTIGKPVFHGVLTFHADEKPGDALAEELACKYLDGVGMVNTQRLVVAHNDARHYHLHLVANRIDLDGGAIHNFPEILRSRDTVQELVRDYGLVPVGEKDLRQVNYDALDASDTRKYAIYRTIRDSLSQVKDMGELEKRLLAEGIETRYRLDQAGQRIGVSFLYQNEAFRGSEIDRKCSLPALERAVGQRLELSQWESEKRVIGKEIVKEEKVVREREALAARKVQEAREAQEVLRKQQELKEQQVLAEEQRQREKQKQVVEPNEQRLRQGPRLRMH